MEEDFALKDEEALVDSRLAKQAGDLRVVEAGESGAGFGGPEEDVDSAALEGKGEVVDSQLVGPGGDTGFEGTAHGEVAVGFGDGGVVGALDGRFARQEWIGVRVS
jgi:hypothetical protein